MYVDAIRVIMFIQCEVTILTQLGVCTLGHRVGQRRTDTSTIASCHYVRCVLTSNCMQPYIRPGSQFTHTYQWHCRIRVVLETKRLFPAFGQFFNTTVLAKRSSCVYRHTGSKAYNDRVHVYLWPWGIYSLVKWDLWFCKQSHPQAVDLGLRL